MFTNKPGRNMEQASAAGSGGSGNVERSGDHPSAPAQPGTDSPSLIGEDLTITGNIISKGEIQVDGRVQGDIQCASLIVGEDAQITGSIVADDIVVRGRILGTIRGQRLSLQNTCHVEADISHKSLVIEQGAFFEGKSRRSDEPNPDKLREVSDAKRGQNPATAMNRGQAPGPQAVAPSKPAE